MVEPNQPDSSAVTFSVRTLFFVTLLVAAFLGGRESMRPQLLEQKAESDHVRAQIYQERLEAEHANLRAKEAIQQLNVLRSEHTQTNRPIEAED